MNEPSEPESFNPTESESKGSHFERDYQSFDLTTENFRQTIIDSSSTEAPEGYTIIDNTKLSGTSIIKNEVLRRNGLDIAYVWPADHAAAGGSEKFITLYVRPEHERRFYAMRGAFMKNFSEGIEYLEDGRIRGNLDILLDKSYNDPIVPFHNLLAPAHPEALVNSDYGRQLKNSNDARQHDLIERSFMTAMLKRRKDHPHLRQSEADLAVYEKLASAGLTPLGMEEIAGLVNAEVNQIFRDHPELRPDREEDENV